jgi:hypothetical protein
MMNRSAIVSAELGLMLIVPDHDAVPLVASLFNSADDPYAIRMAFHVGLDEPVEWIFARDLLAAGLKGAAGEGDVRVWPGYPEDHEVLNIALSSPFGQAHFEAPMAATADRAPYLLGDRGRPRDDFVDLDGELDELLWRPDRPRSPTGPPTCVRGRPAALVGPGRLQGR